MRPISASRRAPTIPPATASERLLLVTKLAAPPIRTDLLSRPQLVHLLEQGLQRPLILVAAPAGFGKTTLLCAWRERASLPIAWMSLEQSDNDITRFWTYVLSALERIEPGSGTAALGLLEGSHLRPPPPIESVLTVWINTLAALPREVALILDDYHLITAPTIHRALTYLLEHQPSQLHLIIATRADPPLPLARLRARGQLIEMRAADLRFTSAEVEALMAATLDCQLSSEEVAALEARTEGWIAGLQLAVLSMRGRADRSAFLSAFSGSHHYIVDYLVQEVLARQPEPIQSFLLRTAILDRLQGSLCEAVLGEAGAETSGQALLEQVAQANLFLTPLDEERRWFRYHPLFAEALRHRLQRDQRQLLPELHRRASRWYEQHDLTAGAIQHALAAAEYEQAAALIERTAEHHVKRGELALLRDWLQALPSEMVHSRMELCLWRAWLLIQDSQFDEAERLLAGLESAFLANGLPSLTGDGAGRVAAIRAYSAFRRGDAPRVIDYGHLALQHLPQGHTSRALVAWNMGIAYLWSDEFAAATNGLTEAMEQSQASGNSYIAFMATFELAQTHARQGHLIQADQSYQHVLDLSEAHGERLAATGPVYVGRGDLQREWNHLEMATQSLREGIARCQQTGNAAILSLGYVTLARVKQAQGDVVEARALIQRIDHLLHTSQLPPVNLAAIRAWQVRLALAQGEIAQASQWVAERQLRAGDELSAPREVEYQTLARVLIAQGQRDAALSLLERLLRLAESHGRMGSALETLVLQAVALEGSGNEPAALAALSRALSLAEPEGYIRLFVDEGAPVARLLSRMRLRRERGSSELATYSGRLLAILDGEADPEPARAVPTAVGVDHLTEPLSERELAVLRLIATGASNQEIADRLVLALSTIKWYINTIYGKLSVDSRTKAIARARELNLL